MLNGDRGGGTVELDIASADAQGRVFLTWTPASATIGLTPADSRQPTRVTLRSATSGGRVRFATTRTHQAAPELALTLPANGEPVPFFVAGSFGQPSTALDDGAVQVRVVGRSGIVLERKLTVRIRKDARDAHRRRARPVPRCVRNAQRRRQRPLP